MTKRAMAVIVLICLTLLPLSGAIVADYVPAPSLLFTQGVPPFATSQFIAHLGTITVTATAGEPLYQPSMVDANISNDFQFSGPVTWWSSGNPPVPQYTTQTTGFQLAVVTNEPGVSGYRKIWLGDGIEPLTITTNALPGSFFEAKLYLLGHQNSSIYKPGAVYTLTSGTIGSFNVAVAATNYGIFYQYIPKVYVPVGDQTIPLGGGAPPNPPPLIPPGTPSLPYGDPPDQAVYGFSILDEMAFSLPSGYLTNTTQIANAHLTLSNTTAGTTYGVHITFSKQPGSSSFALRPVSNPSGYAIPYLLKFLGQSVVLDTPIAWTPLSDGVNTTAILITGISPPVAEAAPSGGVKDTIVVTITPID